MKQNKIASGEQNRLDLKTKFLLEAIDEAQETNRFLDAKAGVLVGIESTLLFVVVATIFDSQKYIVIKQTMLSMPSWNVSLILLYCLAYLVFLILHIIYTVKVLSPSKNPEKFIQIDGYKPKGLFFLSKNRSDGKIHPSMNEYYKKLSSLEEGEILKELIFEFMKMSYIRDTKSDRIEKSLAVLSYLIVGIMVFGVILVASY